MGVCVAVTPISRLERKHAKIDMTALYFLAVFRAQKTNDAKSPTDSESMLKIPSIHTEFVNWTRRQSGLIRVWNYATVYRASEKRRV